MARVGLVLIAALAAITVGFMVRAGEPWNSAWWVSILPFAAWSLSPYAALGLLAWRLRAREAASLVILVGILVVGATGVFVLYDAFVAHLDPQSGLVFVFLPLLQWGGVVVIGVLALLLGRLARAG